MVLHVGTLPASIPSVLPVFQIVDSDRKHVLKSCQFVSETDHTRKLEPADGCPSHHPVSDFVSDKICHFLHKIIEEIVFFLV